jgi:GTP-binding protein
MFKAEDGRNGKGANKKGKDGKSIFITIPLGTTVFEEKENDKIFLYDIDEEKEGVVAKGGKGGRGNAAFKSSTNQAPDIFEEGEKGEEKKLYLTLKLIADVGIVGFPNVGKSTLISKISSAKPKVSSYSFTTLIPNLGVVKVDEENSFVATDLPGLIEGAASGKGMGNIFLKHIERCKILLFLLDPSQSISVKTQYEILKKEIKSFKKEILQKNQIICINKVDLINKKHRDNISKVFKDVLFISALKEKNLKKLIFKIWNFIK